MQPRQKKPDVARLMFRASLLFVLFLAGGEFAKRGWQPYQMFEDGYKAAKKLVAQARQTRPAIVEKLRYAGDGVTRHDPRRAYEGVTLMQGWFASEGPELRLVDMDGTLLHRWPADFYRIWPDPSHVSPASDLPATRFNYHLQGMWLLPDGSVIFNFSELGAVKLDKCGVVQWTLDRMTHHSITPNPDGSFWFPARNDHRKVTDDLRLFGITREELSVFGRTYEDLLLLVDAGGQVTKELSVLRALADGGFEQQLFDAGIIDKFDPTHVNDIEVVSPALANKITGVAAGDLLVSMRNLHMLAILDSDTGRIKWHQTGPWVRQHDPDITEQGNIEVFNNRSDYTRLGQPAQQLPGSNLVSLDPATGQTGIIYPGPGQESFYTRIQGTHQLLGNGNRLINESKAGRVFEVDAQGAIVWEYVKPFDAEYAALIEDVIRFEKDYLEVRDWSCP